MVKGLSRLIAVLFGQAAEDGDVRGIQRRHAYRPEGDLLTPPGDLTDRLGEAARN